ncbi:MAG: septum formation initiator family protein [Rhodospirillales bacterium]|nr:septum formation initiator family protein [Rhodospirillales bacterium]
MQVGRMVRRKARAVAAPAVFLLLVAYFLWNATQGAHGLRAYADRQQDLVAAQAGLERAKTELATWQRRVDGLRTRIDGDALDERARAMLNLSDPQDVIVPYGKGQRLF